MRFNYWQSFEEGCFYHVYNQSVGTGKELLFRFDGNCEDFLHKWDKYLKPYLDLYAYCLMGNHFHFLVYVKPIDSAIIASIERELTVHAANVLNGDIDYHLFLMDQFKRLLSSYVLKFNGQQKRHGSLLQDRIKRVKVPEKRVLDKCCYIHHNPVHHRFQTEYAGWRYGSYDTYLDDRIASVVREKGLALFGASLSNRSKFIKYHQKFKENFKNFYRYYDNI
jgi:putative transposase